MGSVVGEKIVRAMERGAQERLPVVLVTANGGGARMQEGFLPDADGENQRGGGSPGSRRRSLYRRLDRSHDGRRLRLLCLAGRCDSAEPGALIGFAGRRVGNQDMGMQLPDDFKHQSSSFDVGR